VRDRIEQAVVANALEPEWEAVFEPNSYGFRPGRSCQDAIEQSFLRLQKGRDTWVLEADIKGFFDNIAHESILRQLGNFPGKTRIQGWLKAGFIYQGEYTPTEMGTPQGGVISPLLANIGLHGLEDFIKATNKKLGVVRYADDFIVTARDKGSLEKAQAQIQQWMSERGLELAREKTLITSMEDGFDFLGFNHRHYGGKLLIKPSKKKVLDFCKRIGKEITALNGVEQEVVIKKLNPILRGFACLLQRSGQQRNLQLHLQKGVAVPLALGETAAPQQKHQVGLETLLPHNRWRKVDIRLPKRKTG
jgi:RNA-directed DNA polymerase